jgi:hypothetical protein
MAAASLPRPAAALTITPFFDSSITSASNAAQLESAITVAADTIEALFTNSGSVGIVFNQASGGFLGQSQTANFTMSYTAYKNLLHADSVANPANTVLSTAYANLSKGNDANGSGTVSLTTADSRLALGHNAGACFNSSGAFVSGCGQSYDGIVTIGSSFAFNYTTTPVSGEYSAISVAEHEIDEILGGGGQGSVLNAGSSGTYGVLDLYRYAAANTPSFTTSSSASSYFSVDGGVSDIVGFNQTSTGDFADFSTNNNVQSAFTSSGILPTFDMSSPEFTMLESIGYNGVVPEPASMAILGTALAGLTGMRRRRAPRLQ